MLFLGLFFSFVASTKKKRNEEERGVKDLKREIFSSSFPDTV
jgi:hypothetical protein